MQEDGKTADKVVVQDKRSIYYVRYPNLAIYRCLTMASGHSLPILYHMGEGAMLPEEGVAVDLT